MDIDSELDLDLSSVIDAVKRASDNELAKLSEISTKLDGSPVRSGVPAVKAELDAKKIEDAVKNGVESATVAVKQSEPKRKVGRRNRPAGQRAARSNEVELEVNAPEVAAQTQATVTPVNRIADNPLPEPEQKVPEKKERAKNPQPVVVAPPVVSAQPTVSAESTATSDVEVTVDSLDNMPDKVEQAVKDGLSGFDGYWKDTAGKLRRKDGKYASKKETQSYNAAEVARDRQQEQASKESTQQTGLFAQFATTLKDFAGGRIQSTLEKNNDATDAAGTAAGGSFFYSAKEMYNLSKESKKAFDETKQSVADTKSKLSGARDSVAASKIGQILGVKSSADKAASSADSSESESSESVENVSVSNDASQSEKLQSTSDIASDESSERDHARVNTASSERVSDLTATSNSERASDLSKVETLLGSIERSASQDSSAREQDTSNSERVIATSDTQANSITNDRISSSEIATQTSSTSQIDSAKDAQYKSEHLEVLREQTTEQQSMVNEIIDKLDDVKKASGSSGSSGGGLMDLAGDLFDRKGRNGKRGRAGKGGKAGKVKSVLGGAKGLASKGMSMAGGAFSGLSKLGGIAGKAVPFLAPALMAYDAVSGFNNTEKQKEVFDLKEGQEASLGQKSSMALGSLLDMGGLVSGGAGLLGSALGAMGFEGAQEALTFDSGSMAKGIYSFFGGGDKPESNNTKPDAAASNTETAQSKTREERREERLRESEYRADAVEYKGAGSQERYEMELAADPQRHTVDQIKERAKETGSSYKDTYQQMKQESEQYNRERQAVAEEMGLDMSGNIDHPLFGSMYSPQKKGDQLKKVDAEVERRREVEVMAKDGDFRNARFIGSEPAGFMESLNTKIGIEQQKQADQQAALDAQGFSLIDPSKPEQAAPTTSSETTVTPVGEMPTFSNAGIAQDPAIPSFADAPAYPVMGSPEPTAKSNQRVSDIKAQQSDKAFREGDKPQSVKLDDETIKKITKVSATSSTTTTNKTSEKVSKTNQTAASPAKSTGSIPNNFSDRSLQRQSADLE